MSSASSSRRPPRQGTPARARVSGRFTRCVLFLHVKENAAAAGSNFKDRSVAPTFSVQRYEVEQFGIELELARVVRKCGVTADMCLGRNEAAVERRRPAETRIA